MAAFRQFVLRKAKACTGRRRLMRCTPGR
jgi:hypothetical protein